MKFLFSAWIILALWPSLYVVWAFITNDLRSNALLLLPLVYVASWYFASDWVKSWRD